MTRAELEAKRADEAFKKFNKTPPTPGAAQRESTATPPRGHSKTCNCTLPHTYCQDCGLKDNLNLENQLMQEQLKRNRIQAGAVDNCREPGQLVIGTVTQLNSNPTGWLCPKCGRGNAPWSQTCPCVFDNTITVRG
jgi:hypothetical protein